MSIVYVNIRISGKLTSNQYDTYDLKEPSHEQYLSSFRNVHASIGTNDFHANVAPHLATTTSKNGIHTQTQVIDVKLRTTTEIVIYFKINSNYVLLMTFNFGIYIVFSNGGIGLLFLWGWWALLLPCS
jgi:hypothetical protein